MAESGPGPGLSPESGQTADAPKNVSATSELDFDFEKEFGIPLNFLEQSTLDPSALTQVPLGMGRSHLITCTRGWVVCSW